jgi:hypothetical protein
LRLDIDLRVHVFPSRVTIIVGFIAPAAVLKTQPTPRLNISNNGLNLKIGFKIKNERLPDAAKNSLKFVADSQLYFPSREEFLPLSIAVVVAMLTVVCSAVLDSEFINE